MTIFDGMVTFNGNLTNNFNRVDIVAHTLAIFTGNFTSDGTFRKLKHM